MKRFFLVTASIALLAATACTPSPTSTTDSPPAETDTLPEGVWSESSSPGETTLVFSPTEGLPIALVCNGNTQSLLVETADASFDRHEDAAAATLYLGDFLVEDETVRMGLGEGRYLYQMSTDLTGEVLIGLTSATGLRLIAGDAFVETGALDPAQARAFAERCASLKTTAPPGP
jgi:hypothetical protein